VPASSTRVCSHPWYKDGKRQELSHAPYTSTIVSGKVLVSAQAVRKAVNRVVLGYRWRLLKQIRDPRKK